MAGKVPIEYPVNVYLEKKIPGSSNDKYKFFPFTKPGNITLDSTPENRNKTLDIWYNEQNRYNESVKEQIDELKKEVDRLNGIKSCMKYSTEEIILKSDEISNKTFVFSTRNIENDRTDQDRIAYFDFNAENINERSFKYV